MCMRIVSEMTKSKTNIKLMKKILILIYLYAIAFNVNAQRETKPQKYRYIYLWDVTLSMKGYNGAPDIYDDVVDFLLEDIDGLPNGKNREVIVCPFQEKILETWQNVCTVEGKNSIKKYISNFNNGDVTYTNLVDPLKYVVRNFVDPQKYETTVYLLTDGNQNAKDASEPLKTYLDDNWEIDKMNAYLKIVRLVPGILTDIEGVIEGHERPLDIIPLSEMNYNIIEANKEKLQEIKVTFSTNPTNRAIPSGVKVHVRSDKNSIIKVDEVIEIKDGVLAIPMKYDYEVIRKQFSGMKKMTLHYTLHEDSKRVNGKHNGKDEKYVIHITSPYTDVDVVNEPQKTLKITLK